MLDLVLLDSGLLGMVSHPRPSTDIAVWLGDLIVAGVEILVPEIADYEVRRELLRANRTRGIGATFVRELIAPVYSPAVPPPNRPRLQIVRADPLPNSEQQFSPRLRANRDEPRAMA